ncbi:MAG: glycerophosphodiester phosphodiesterase [Pannonibacter sp.]
MKKAVLICHRGLSRKAPENTLAALEAAIAAGADVVEFDIHTSCDGVLYVIHDETVDRTSNGHGRVADMTSAELDRLDAGSWFSPAFAGERLPRLSVFLDACKGRIGTYAEIKAADPARVRDMLAARGMLSRAWSFSFDQDIRAQMRARVPDLRRMVLFQHMGSVERAVAAEAHILEFHEGNLTPERVARAREAGLVTQMFYAGSEEAVFERAIRCGIEQMNIDEAELFRAVEARMLAETI